MASSSLVRTMMTHCWMVMNYAGPLILLCLSRVVVTFPHDHGHMAFHPALSTFKTPLKTTHDHPIDGHHQHCPQDYSTATSISPNRFTHEHTFAYDKLFGHVWYEYIFYTEAENGSASNPWLSYVVKFTRPPLTGKGKNKANFTAAAKQNRVNCTTVHGTFYFSDHIPDLVENIRAIGLVPNDTTKEESVWILNRKDEDFLLLARCFSNYFKDWSDQRAKCDTWNFHIYFPRPNIDFDSKEVQTAIHELRHRVCYPIERLRNFTTIAKKDCMGLLTGNRNAISFVPIIFGLILVFFAVFGSF